MNEKKFRKNFSQNSSGQQNVTFFWGSERRKRNFQVYFMTNYRRKTVILKYSFERARKNYTVEKKNSCQKPIRKKSYDHFSENIFQKKIENSNIMFAIGEKKKFFFEKFSGPDFDPNFENVTFCWPHEF